jgi:hypothetical protein
MGIFFEQIEDQARNAEPERIANDKNGFFDGNSPN